MLNPPLTSVKSLFRYWELKLWLKISFLVEVVNTWKLHNISKFWAEINICILNYVGVFKPEELYVWDSKVLISGFNKYFLKKTCQWLHQLDLVWTISCLAWSRKVTSNFLPLHYRSCTVTQQLHDIL